MDELDVIPGSGRNGRVQKKDILNYVKQGRRLLLRNPYLRPLFQDLLARLHQQKNRKYQFRSVPGMRSLKWTG